MRIATQKPYSIVIVMALAAMLAVGGVLALGLFESADA